MLQCRVLELFSSNLEQDRGLQSLQTNAEVVTWLSYECFLPNPFPVHQSSYHLMLHYDQWGGTKSTGYCGHFWPIVQAPDDRWGWLWSNWWNEDWQGKLKYLEKTCPSAALSATNHLMLHSFDTINVIKEPSPPKRPLGALIYHSLSLIIGQ
jgi:hypothetical protein